MEKFELADGESISTIIENCLEENPTACRKNLGETKRMRHWSRGHNSLFEQVDILIHFNHSTSETQFESY
jgi:hypothetical protein